MKNYIKHLENYISLRRTLGYKLKDEAKIIGDFIGFIKTRDSKIITVKLAMEWAQKPRGVQASHWSQRLSKVRLFLRYLKAYIPSTEVPPADLIKVKAKRTQPYIYKEAEIVQILNACLLASSKGLRHLTYYTLFGLLSVSGCRIGEIVNLAARDVNLKSGIVTIRNSKHENSRSLPVTASTNERLVAYSKQRDMFLGKFSDDYFFLSELGKKLTVNGIEIFFVRLSKKIGLRNENDSHGPRIHDFRHSFALNALIRCYKNGADINQIILFLSTYLGHKKPSDTYWYLSNVPELMALAATRLELFGGLE